MLCRAGGGWKQTHVLTGIELQSPGEQVASAHFFCLGKGRSSLVFFHNRHEVVRKKKKERKNQPFQGSGEQQTEYLVSTCEDGGVERSSCPLKLRNLELGSLGFALLESGSQSRNQRPRKAHPSRWPCVVLGVSGLGVGNLTYYYPLTFGLQKCLESSISQHS